MQKRHHPMLSSVYPPPLRGVGGGLGSRGLYLKQNILTIRAFTIYPFLIFAPFKYLLVISLLVIGLQNPDNHSFVKKHNLN